MREVSIGFICFVLGALGMYFLVINSPDFVCEPENIPPEAEIVEGLWKSEKALVDWQNEILEICAEAEKKERENLKKEIIESISPYDPNDPIYQYIPRAHESWTTQFGDNHKTRMIHAVSELRVQQAILSKRMAALEKELAPEVPSDPNGVKE